MLAAMLTLLAAAEEPAEEVNEASDLYPHWEELLVGALAFAILFYFMRKWVFPRVGGLLDERRQKIQGELEQAEATRAEADRLLADYRQQLADARDEGNRIIEEARHTADQVRADLQAKAEQEAQGTVARAQEEIRAERDRVFQELRGQVGEIAVELAGRVVGQSLDKRAHERLIDEYIDQVADGRART
jgi:F-type H+-transporting ATPase subunit b